MKTQSSSAITNKSKENITNLKNAAKKQITKAYMACVFLNKSINHHFFILGKPLQVKYHHPTEKMKTPLTE